jgi:hypothetical protein
VSDVMMAAQMVTAPLTFGQMSVLRSMQYNLSRGARALAEANIQVVWPLPSGTSVEAVRRAWRRLVEHNESLRTVFDWERPDPMQTVLDASGPALGIVQVSCNSMAHADNVTADLVGQPIHIERELPWRGSVITHQGTPKYLALIVHHIAADHFALSKLAEQFAVVLAGQEPCPTKQPAELAREQRAAFDRNEETLGFWVDQWNDFAPEDRAGEDHTERSQAAIYSSAALAAAVSTGKQLGISLQSVALGVAYLVLADLKDRSRFTLGLMSGNRFDEEQEAVISSMVQISALTTDVEPEAEVAAYLRDTYFRSLEAYEFGTYDIDALRDRLVAEKANNPEPMEFDCYFNFVEAVRAEPEGNSPLITHVEWVQRNVRQTGPRLNLLVGVGDGLFVSLRASAGYLARSRIADFLVAYEAALVEIAANPFAPIRDLRFRPLRHVQGG